MEPGLAVASKELPGFVMIMHPGGGVSAFFHCAEVVAVTSFDNGTNVVLRHSGLLTLSDVSPDSVYKAMVEASSDAEDLG
jgi:hypothetical protein